RQRDRTGRDACRKRGRPPARHQQEPGSDRPVEASEPEIGPRPWRRDGVDPVSGRIRNARGRIAHGYGYLWRTLPFSVSKVLPPFFAVVTSGAAFAEPSTSLRLGPAGPRVFICSATLQTFVCMASVFL